MLCLQGDIPKIPTNKVINSTQPKIDWSVKPAEKAKYDQLFDSLQPTNGVIPGNKVNTFLEGYFLLYVFLPSITNFNVASFYLNASMELL